MPKYCIVEGEDSELNNYLEGLVDKLGEESTGFYDFSEDKPLQDYVRNYEKVIAVGRFEDERKESLEALTDDKYVISEQELDGGMTFDLEKSVVEKLYREVETLEEKYGARELREKVRSFDKIGIILHDSPDPDAISSGIAFEQMCESEDVETEILYSDEINHQENKAMVNKLDLDLSRVDVKRYFENDEEKFDITKNGTEFDLDDYDGIALLDTSMTNSKILEPFRDDITPDIVIDHHDGWEVELDDGLFYDVRTDRGAVASIMADYFRMLDIQPNKTVSTALVHGILSDTLNLDPSSHNFTEQDINNLAMLYRNTDSSSLAEIKESSKSLETAKILSSAIEYHNRDGTKLYSYVGEVNDADAIPQAADYLVDLEGVNTSFVYGIQKGDNKKIRVSARNNDIKINLGKQLERIFEEIDVQGNYGVSAGGSSTKGGASIPFKALGMMEKTLTEKNDIENLRPAIEAVVESYLFEVGST